MLSQRLSLQNKSLRERLSLFSVLVIIAALVTACDQDRPKEAHRPPAHIQPDGVEGVQNFGVSGDPEVFIRGTQLNQGQGGLPTKLLPEGSLWKLDMVGFSRTPLKPKTAEEELKWQSPEQISQRNEKNALNPTRYKVSLSEDGLIDLKPNTTPANDGKTPSQFFFKKREGLIHLTSLRGLGAPSDMISLEHISFKKNAFSLLLKLTDSELPEGEQVLGVYAFYFVRSENIFEKISEIFKIKKNAIFEYLEGRGKKLSWDQKDSLEISVCSHSDVPGLLKTTREAIEAWKLPLLNRLRVSGDEPESCHPFSDLNHQNIQVIDNFSIFPGKAFRVGSTSYLPDYENRRIRDADIFIHKSEIDRLLELGESSKNFSEILRSSLIHQIGHMMGLGHQFNPKYSSVMTYGKNRSEYPSFHDERALKALYSKLQ